MSTKVFTYEFADIFTDVDSQGECTMTIPPEILEAMNWKENDLLQIKLGDKGSIHISKSVEENKDVDTVTIVKALHE